MSPNGPSEPGEPPAVDTGRLRASITHRVVEEPTGPSAEVGTNVEYAFWLEFGTSTKEGAPKMLPRPFLQPAVQANAAQIVRIVGEAMKRAGR
jgi:HK97 gp10 family phage protein